MVPDKLEMGSRLALRRCPHPHCGIASPNLTLTFGQTGPVDQSAIWSAYVCQTCKDLVTVRGHEEDGKNYVDEIYPAPRTPSDDLPATAKTYLDQAYTSLGEAPDGGAMLASSAVEAMLKDKGIGTAGDRLVERIDKAVEKHLLTREMGEWAHKVRLVSNDPRHADDENPHVSAEQAKVVVEFAEALGHFLYVLPSRVAKGIGDADRADSTEQGTHDD